VELGWTALVVMVLFGGIAFLVLVVASSGDEIAGLTSEERRPDDRGPDVAPRTPNEPATRIRELLAAKPRAAEPSPEDRYATAQAASLRRAAWKLAERANLREGERILDLATGGTLAGVPSIGLANTISDRDAARGLLRVAPTPQPRGTRRRREKPPPLPSDSGWYDVVVSVHSLHQVENPRATLAECRRVTRSGGRIALSVPGPRTALLVTRYDRIYRRHGIRRKMVVPSPAKLRTWASGAGWRDIVVQADSSSTFEVDPEAFRAWLETFALVGLDVTLEPDRLEALIDDLLAATPAVPQGLRIADGTLYLTAYNP
jgi:SAM-dependent methyltransferase